MKRLLLKSMVAIVWAAIYSPTSYGQVSSMGSFSGVVADPSGAMVPNAVITVKSTATGEVFIAHTADNGTFTVPALAAGVYTMAIAAEGFKTSIVPDVKIDVGKPSSVSVALQVGAANESITITGSGGELLQAQTANVATTITGRQIYELPFTSRDTLDLLLLLPGTQTPGRPRSSTINGLPKGALNVTLDGVNVQENAGKSGDGFFTWIRPRLDAVEEVTVSTATPGAESAAEGAVQIKFATRSGTNEYHGSLYWYHRNPALNANYYFNNRDLPPDPRTGKAPRNRVLLNQPGFRLGGPISIPGLFQGRDRAFFFVNYEEFRLPTQQLRQRIILSPLAEQGVFQYPAASGVQSVNLLALAAAGGQVATVDPTVAQILADIRGTTGQGGVDALTDRNLQRFSFVSAASTIRRLPTVRLDFNLTSRHHLENTWNYQKFDGTPSIFFNLDPAFPGFPNRGSLHDDRFSNATALRSTLSPRWVNEARFGLLGGTGRPITGIHPAQFSNQSGFAIGRDVNNAGFSAAGISNPTVSTTTRRLNVPVRQFTDTLTYVRGAHGFNFGASFSQIGFWNESPAGGVVPTVTFGLAPGDPAASLFTSANFPGASNAQISQAAALYAVLTGRVTAVDARAYLDEKTGQYRYLGPFVDRLRQREFGLFAQDAWRARPHLTVNYGLRWEVQFPFVAQNRNYTRTARAGLFGVSGEGNLFKPGVLAGNITEFTPFHVGDRAYDPSYHHFAPSAGVAWSPDGTRGFLRRLFGEAGQSVIRAGYSIAYIREGMNVPAAVLGSNPGGSVNLTRSIAQGNLTAGTLFRDRERLAPPAFPNAPSYPLRGAATDSANAFDPHLTLGYAQSWTFGIQRAITKNMVFEARYVGTRGVKLWRRYNLNEVNVTENGFLEEFRLAQANLQANLAAGRGSTFRYFGPGTGTFPLPTTLAYFSGIPRAQAGDAALYTSPRFSDLNFVTPLFSNHANPQGLASLLFNDASQRRNALAAGRPANFFVVNPNYLGGAFLVDNGGRAAYDALTLELRRRFSAGLLVQASYTFSKALTNLYDNNQTVLSQPATLRSPRLDKALSPFDITQAFKAIWIYELPFGRGRMFLHGAHGVLDRMLGGWEWHGLARVQGGTPFSFGNVQLVNLTRQELQDSVRIRKDPNKIVFYLPDDVILNTRRAFNVTANGYSALGAPAPDSRYIAPAGSGGCLPGYVGQCGFANLVLHGPHFVRFDMSVVKRIALTERANLELRAEFLNALNNINFKVGSPDAEVTRIGNFNSPVFGQTAFAYQDTATTNDPGGRLVQFVVRINF